MYCALHASRLIAFLFFFNDTATTEIYTLSLHDALPIVHAGPDQRGGGRIPVAQRLRRRQRQPEQSAQETQANGGKGRPVGDLAWAYVGGHRIEYKRDPLAASFSIRRLLGVLRDNRNFRTLYAANAVSQLGDWFNVVALFSLLLELTGKGEAVAYALLTRFVPMFLAGPAAGVLADRISRRAIMVASDLPRVAPVLCLLFIRQADQVWIAYAVVTAHSVVSALFEPAQQAMLPNLGSPEPSRCSWSATWPLRSVRRSVTR